MCFSVHRQPTIAFPYRVNHYLVNDLKQHCRRYKLMQLMISTSQLIIIKILWDIYSHQNQFLKDIQIK